MGFLERLSRKTSEKAADRVSDKIVNKVFGKKKEEEYVAPAAPAEQEEAAPAEPETAELTEEQKQAIASAQAASAENVQAAMGIAYNSKKCPECQALCMNAPVTCPYCGADLKGVTPLTPEELEKLMDKE